MSRGLWSRLFPVPRALLMRGGGIEIAEGSVKYFRFDRRASNRTVGAFGEENLPEGAVVEGEIRDNAALIEALAKVRARAGFSLAHASLSESRGYLFDASIPRVSAAPLLERVALTLPEHAPLSPAESVFDCEFIPEESTPSVRSVAVAAFPEETATLFGQAIETAGFFPVSFELEPQAAARAILWGASAPARAGAHLFVDFGVERAVISIVQNGVVRFATSANGSSSWDEKLTSAAAGKSIEDLKAAEGLASGTETQKIFSGSAEMLAKALDRVRVFWHLKPEKGERREPIRSVVLYGGNANVQGLSGFLARTLNLPCEKASLRSALMPQGGSLPPIEESEALRFATVIGLALRPFVLS